MKLRQPIPDDLLLAELRRGELRESVVRRFAVKLQSLRAQPSHRTGLLRHHRGGLASKAWAGFQKRLELRPFTENGLGPAAPRLDRRRALLDDVANAAA